MISTDQYRQVIGSWAGGGLLAGRVGRMEIKQGRRGRIVIVIIMMIIMPTDLKIPSKPSHIKLICVRVFYLMVWRAVIFFSSNCSTQSKSI